MKNILGTKIGMTRIFDAKGVSIPVTVVKIDSCWVLGRKTTENDGYSAVQVGYGELLERKANKPQKGFAAKTGGKIPRLVREFRVNEEEAVNIGDELKANVFEIGDYVDITGNSKGKGYAGAMKRHGFGGLPASHGHGEYRRAPGGMAASSYPSRVFKGKKLPGHMGDETVTIQKLEVVDVNLDDNLLLIKGAIPGIKGDTVVIKETNRVLKKKKIVEAKAQEVKLNKKR